MEGRGKQAINERDYFRDFVHMNLEFSKHRKQATGFHHVRSRMSLFNKRLYTTFSSTASTEVTLCFVLSQAGTVSTLYRSLQTLAKNDGMT